jgi:multidrug efflux pump subunit AcrA (membrane-fusion protein)
MLPDGVTLFVALPDQSTLVYIDTVSNNESRRVKLPFNVSWISTSVDEKTRTLKVRANLTNPKGRLRASTFGQGRIILREEKRAIVVPNEAVHWEGDCHVAFVRDKHYDPRGGEHWSNCMSMLVTGGLTHGQVVGSTEAKGGEVKEGRVTPSDLGATVCRHLDIDLDSQWIDLYGRPQPIITEGGRPIPALSR